ncbi:ribokinase [uncultured Ilyobacter sp.]|uniref:ribokinase n=1 Tax=uncultured Ilyobacter sp. TaxID=544433 RepID=UPI0029C03FFA|nr:ribokinase [uncultured Ilyobacter sp.]
MGKILVVGSINMDLVTRAFKSPRIGETILGKDFKQIPGGKGANQAVAVARLGSDVSLIGMVGEDSFGDTLLSVIKKDGVDISGVGRCRDRSTGIATIVVDDDANNSIIVVPGANFEIKKEDIDANIKLYENSEIVVHQLETPLDIVEYSLKISKKLGKTTILNPAPAKAMSDEIIKNVDYLIPNETELELLSGVPVKTKEDILKACRKIMTKGVKKLIVTLGSKGAIYVDGEGTREFGVYKVDAVDTTAAGDSFIGGFTAALSKGESIEKAMDFAAKVGAITVTREGAQTSLPTLDEVMNFKGVI